MKKNTGPDSEIFRPDPEKQKSAAGQLVVIKYGGNAMVDERAQELLLDQIALLIEYGIQPVIVHGGGPFIRTLLETAGVESRFVGGHRVTDEAAMEYVEMALNGKVNGVIVRELNERGIKAVGLSGKDAAMVRAVKRSGTEDLGYVGNVSSVDTGLIRTLLSEGFLPVLAPIALGEDFREYNINADMFAGHIAGALNADAFIALTNVDGLLEDPDRPETLIGTVRQQDVDELMGSVIKGGMIPKMEACLAALSQGVKRAHIINGMKPDTLLATLLTNRTCGTIIESSEQTG